MIVINGKTFADGSEEIVNGRIVGCEEAYMELRKLNEKRTEEASGIEWITINSDVDVTISTSDLPIAEVHFYGGAILEAEPLFEVINRNEELMVTVKLEGNCVNSELKLDVTVPKKKYRNIIVNSSFSDICVDDVESNSVIINTTLGDIEVDGKVDSCSVGTHYGDVNIYIEAKRDIYVGASVTNGDISVELKDVGELDLQARSENGKVKNRFKGRKGHSALVEAHTMNGNIRVR